MRLLRPAYLDLVHPGEIATKQQFDSLFARIHIGEKPWFRHLLCICLFGSDRYSLNFVQRDLVTRRITTSCVSHQRRGLRGYVQRRGLANRIAAVTLAGPKSYRSTGADSGPAVPQLKETAPREPRAPHTHLNRG
jgi:hypothetical protein